jgi:hypothetical protein
VANKEVQCSFEACIDPEEIGCNRGFFLEDCKHWKKAHPQSAGRTKETSSSDTANGVSGQKGDSHLRLPWSGNSLGLRDVGIVAACAPATMIGVVGPFNSGKTTLLTLIYLLLQHGESLKVGTFAGSSSLIGWENLAAKLRWSSGTQGPMFPPHTSRAAGRRPGLLHVAMRSTDGVRRDFLFTDPPGEWFTLWAQKEAADGAEGARWVQRHAHRFLFLVDREALASPERGKARDDLRDLARRLSPGLDGRSVAIVWTKSDKEVKPVIEQDLRECFAAEFPDHAEFNVRMRFGNETHEDVEAPCLSLMNWALAPPANTRLPRLTLPIQDPSDLFLAFRGKDEA